MAAVGRPVDPSMSNNLKSVLAALALLAVLAAGWLGWGRLNDNGPGPGFVTGAPSAGGATVPAGAGLKAPGSCNWARAGAAMAAAPTRTVMRRSVVML